jgi:nucleotide-binding universal stress UspA family protein
MYKHILIPTDGSVLFNKAIEHGTALAKALGAKVTALTVTEPFYESAFEPMVVEQYKKHVAALAAKHLDVAKNAASASDVACELMRVEHERPYQAIIDTAKSRGCDLIVMASHGRRGISAIVLGSETVKVLTHSTIPVLVCRESPSSALRAGYRAGARISGRQPRHF